MKLKNIITALMFILCTAVSSAGTADEYRVLGFSKDAKYFAYEIYGIRDGSGAAYSGIFIIDTKTGKDCVKPFTEENVEETDLDSARHKNLEKAEAALDKYRINEDTRGETVFDSGTAEQGDDFTAELGGESSWILFSRKPGKRLCIEERKNEHFTISVVSGKNKKKLLYSSKDVKSLCLFNHRLVKIIRYKDRLVFVVSSQSQGFEGPDTTISCIPAVVVR